MEEVGYSNQKEEYVSQSQGRAKAIAIVEAEKTAVILSAHYPQYIWLASGGQGEVQAEKERRTHIY